MTRPTNAELRKLIEHTVGYVNRADGHETRLFGIRVRDTDFNSPGRDLHDFITAMQTIPQLLDEVERLRAALKKITTAQHTHEARTIAHDTLEGDKE